MADKKYIFVTGGVVSSLGKGIAASSIAALLEARGIKITMQKFDPYLNVDPGTMSPFQHGEVYVTEDGAETDLDLGHYERFTNACLTRDNNVTTGKVYKTIIDKERKGEYLGKTVQVVPHVTNEIKNHMKMITKPRNVDVAVIEIGGTVGDIESQPFLEAIRQMQMDVGRENVLYVHLTLVPFIKAAGEIKTKPTQHSVANLRSIGIQPDILLCRTEVKISKNERDKIALFCNVQEEAVIQALDVPTIYQCPRMFHDQKLDDIIVKKLGLRAPKANLKEWDSIVRKILHPKEQVTIAVVGKYIEVQDAYKSIKEAILHGGIANNARVDIKWVDSEKEIEPLIKSKKVSKILGGCDGILVPGGFGDRGIEGKIAAIRFAREKKIPFFGICLGMQMASVEFARNGLGMKGANSTEFDAQTPYPVISKLEEQKHIEYMGASMRLGSYPCKVKAGTKSFAAYGEKIIFERHRHRFEFNGLYRDKFEEKGFLITGTSPDGFLVEMVEYVKHPWFIAVQFHPEFKSRPRCAHPLFRDFVKAALKKKKGK
ncbi:MAG: CTP synthase [Spirochaetia bacterium]|nr:CTP synthase [Spirochaetia bacterium]